jgi:predicted glycosyltransferase
VRVLVDVGHPAHVHFFRHPLQQIQKDGHEVVVTARDNAVAVALLRGFAIPHQVIGPRGAGPRREYVQRLGALLRVIRRTRPDVVTAIGGAFVAPAGRLTGVPSLVFTDTEHVALDRYLTYPWATRICTPDAFARDLPRAQVRYRGLHELAYLAPDRFVRDPAVWRELGLTEGAPYAVVRLVAWRASHDRGQRGLSAEWARTAIDRLSARGRVFVTAEGDFPLALRDLRLDVPPQRMHHVLAYARLYLGEGATMATEAGLLGTPSVYVSTLVGTMGNFDLLEREGLVHSFRDGEAAVERAALLMADAAAKPAATARAASFAAGQIDVPAFVCEQLLDVGSVARMLRFEAARRDAAKERPNRDG